MAFDLQIRHKYFVASVSGIDLRDVGCPNLFDQITQVLDEYPVLTFPDQPFTDEEQINFAERLTGQYGHVFFSRMTNLDDAGKKLEPPDFRRVYSLSTRVWHTDGSCGAVTSRYSMLSARVVPDKGGETEFADMRAAYDLLPEDVKAEIESLQAEHARAYVRHLISYDLVGSPQETIGGVAQPIVYCNPVTGRKSLYLSSSATRILGLPLADGRLMLRDLIEHATQREFVYRHAWRTGDFVIWDNRVTMHRARRYDDTNSVRDLRRATTPDRSSFFIR
jgi:alpha-ketoglutarate-dependent 2,4-dichlorophenoxyacetate dioxygenase